MNLCVGTWYSGSSPAYIWKTFDQAKLNVVQQLKMSCVSFEGENQCILQKLSHTNLSWNTNTERVFSGNNCSQYEIGVLAIWRLYGVSTRTLFFCIFFQIWVWNTPYRRSLLFVCHGLVQTRMKLETVQTSYNFFWAMQSWPIGLGYYALQTKFSIIV